VYQLLFSEEPINHGSFEDQKFFSASLLQGKKKKALQFKKQKGTTFCHSELKVNLKFLSDRKFVGT